MNNFSFATYFLYLVFQCLSSPKSSLQQSGFPAGVKDVSIVFLLYLIVLQYKSFHTCLIKALILVQFLVQLNNLELKI